MGLDVYGFWAASRLVWVRLGASRSGSGSGRLDGSGIWTGLDSGRVLICICSVCLVSSRCVSVGLGSSRCVSVWVSFLVWTGLESGRVWSLDGSGLWSGLWTGLDSGRVWMGVGLDGYGFWVSTCVYVSLGAVVGLDSGRVWTLDS